MDIFGFFVSVGRSGGGFFVQLLEMRYNICGRAKEHQADIIIGMAADTEMVWSVSEMEEFILDNNIMVTSKKDNERESN